MKVTWSKNEAEIVDILRDRQWHCITKEVEQKDDRARITSIRRKLQTVGYDVQSEPCDLHEHKARILMRRIIKVDGEVTTAQLVATNPERLSWFNSLKSV